MFNMFNSPFGQDTKSEKENIEQLSSSKSKSYQEVFILRGFYITRVFILPGEAEAEAEAEAQAKTRKNNKHRTCEA